MVIYKTTNLITGKIYIGKDVKNNPKYLGSGMLLKKSILKYGKDNFIKEIIELCSSKEELCEREIFWISEYNCFSPIGYNICKGGEGGDVFTNNPNRELIREKLKNRITSEETRRKLSIANTGNFHTEETKKKISIKNSNMSAETRRKLSIANKYKVLSEETKKKISEKCKNPSEETRKKISIASKGRKHTEESKQKMSEKSKGEKNPMYGKSVYSVWVEKYGKEEADIRKQKMEETRKKNKDNKVLGDRDGEINP